MVTEQTTIASRRSDINLIPSSAPSVSAKPSVSSLSSAALSGMPLGCISGDVKEDVDTYVVGEVNLVGVLITVVGSQETTAVTVQ